MQNSLTMGNLNSTEKEQRTANTGLAKVAVQCSADTFVVKIATFAKPETVISKPKRQQCNHWADI